MSPLKGSFKGQPCPGEQGSADEGSASPSTPTTPRWAGGALGGYIVGTAKVFGEYVRALYMHTYIYVYIDIQKHIHTYKHIRIYSYMYMNSYILVKTFVHLWVRY